MEDQPDRPSPTDALAWPAGARRCPATPRNPAPTGAAGAHWCPLAVHWQIRPLTGGRGCPLTSAAGAPLAVRRQTWLLTGGRGCPRADLAAHWWTWLSAGRSGCSLVD